MAQGQWFYTRDGQQAGPVSVDDLRQMLAAGQVGGHELVWQEGMANWSPANSIPALSVGSQTAAPAAYQAAPYPQQHAAPPQYGQMPGQPSPYPGGPVVPQYHQPGAGPQSYNGMAIGSLVCSLIGLLCFGPILGIVAIVLSIIAKNGMKRVGNPQGAGMATAGLIIGIIDVVLGGIWMIYFLSNANF